MIVPDFGTADEDVIASWLKGALNGLVPVDSLLDAASDKRMKADLRTGCWFLVVDYVSNPSGNSDVYVKNLVWLATILKTPGCVQYLRHFVECRKSFEALPVSQRNHVLYAIYDSSVPVDASFWALVALAYGDHHKNIAISGLLRHGIEAAVWLMPRLPNDQDMANNLYDSLDQYYTRTKDPKMSGYLSEWCKKCAPFVRESIEKIMSEVSNAS